MKTTAKDVLRRWLYPEPWCREQQVCRAVAESIYLSIESHQRSDRCGYDQPAMDEIVRMGPANVETVLHEINEERQQAEGEPCSTCGSADWMGVCPECGDAE